MNGLHRMFLTLTGVMLALPSVLYAQGAQATGVFDNVDVTDTCSYLGESLSGQVFTFSSDREAEDAIRRIVDISGLSQNFSVHAAGVPNAAAIIRGDERLILYNQGFMRNVRMSTGSEWAPISILAHEVGHHLNGHTLLQGGSRPSIELQADRFSGHAMKRLGASLQDATIAMQRIGNEGGSPTHPAKRDRLAAITNGWLAACDQDPACNTSRTGNTGGLRGIPDTCRWAKDGECDEPEFCAPGTDTADCRGGPCIGRPRERLPLGARRGVRRTGVLRRGYRHR